MVKIYRVEHKDCTGVDFMTGEENSHHGPTQVWTYECQGRWDRPKFGYRHVPPSEDGIPINGNLYCGVTKEQLPLWFHSEHWDASDVPMGWEFAEYEVPDELVNVGRYQVTFPKTDKQFVRWVGQFAEDINVKPIDPGPATYI